MVAERITESEIYMATSKFGFGYHPDEWSVNDDRAVEKVLYWLRSKRDPSNHGRLDEWSQYDEYLSLAVRLRVEAKRVSSEREDLELGQVWNILKRRMLQKIEGNVIDGMFEISNHYKTEIRKIWALAELEEPLDRNKQKEIASVLAMEKSEKFQDAFEADSTRQESLFDCDKYLESEGLQLVETIEDTSSLGGNPQETYEQVDVIDVLLENADLLTKRQKLIVEHIVEFNEDANHSKLARIVGCSRQTIARELKALAPIFISTRRSLEGGEGGYET